MMARRAHRERLLDPCNECETFTDDRLAGETLWSARGRWIGGASGEEPIAGWVHRR